VKESIRDPDPALAIDQFPSGGRHPGALDRIGEELT
jgi:hypothetical protein